jgi:anti-sigma factor RsiW
MASAHEPLSWLTLERYALGELSAEERARVEAQLAESPVDRACLQEILEDRSELSLPSPAPVASVTSLAPARAARRGRWLAVCAALGAAATIVLMVRDQREPAPYDGVKGSDVALRLISDRQGVEPRTFAAGERFKVEVTCPARLGASLRLLIFQGGEVFEP